MWSVVGTLANPGLLLFRAPHKGQDVLGLTTRTSAEPEVAGFTSYKTSSVQPWSCAMTIWVSRGTAAIAVDIARLEATSADVQEILILESRL